MAKAEQNDTITHQAFPNFSEMEKLMDKILDMPDTNEHIKLSPVDKRAYLQGYHDALRAVKTQIIAHCKGF